MSESAAEIRIDRARLADLDRVAPLFDAYRVFYERPSDLEAARRFVRARLENDESVIFLAEVVHSAGTVQSANSANPANPAETAEASDPDRKALGFTQLYPMFSSVRMRPIWILNDLFVAPGARRMGVGRALMRRAAEWARESGAAGLELATARDNAAAKRVYEDLGWSLDTEFDHYCISVEA